MKHKIIAISLIALFAVASLQAQTEKGRFIIGAGSSVDVSNAKGGLSTAPSKTSNTTIIIKPEVGYFLLDDFSVGVSVSVEGYAGDAGGAHADLLSEFKYFFKGTSFRPFVKANVGYKYKDFWGLFGQSIPVSDVQGLAFGGGVGGAFFVRKNISVDLGLNYLHSTLKRVSMPYDQSGPMKEENPLKANMDEITVFVGFSVYL